MVLRFIAPGLMISTASMSSSICGRIRSVDTRIPLAPPNWVFGVVWPLLYVTIGLAWYQSGKNDALFMATLIACCAWLPFNACGPRIIAPIVLMIACLLSVWTTISLSGTNRLLMVPLSLWTAFATYLNIVDVWLYKR